MRQTRADRRPTGRAPIIRSIAAALWLAAFLTAAGTRPAHAADEAGAAEARDFCQRNGRVADDIRRELQIRRLILAEQRIEARITALKAATEEARDWLAKRHELLARADEKLVAIYSRMRPDAAAAQLSMLGNDLAVAILMQLPPRAVGPIMNEMDTVRAGVLATAVAKLRREDDRDREGNS